MSETVHFFQSVLSLLFRLGNLYYSLFKFTDSFLLSSPSSELFISGGVFFFSSKIPIYFFISCISLLTLLIVCFKGVWNCSVKHFYTGCFKILSHNFHVSVISVLVSFDCLFSLALRVSWSWVWRVIFSPGHLITML